MRSTAVLDASFTVRCTSKRRLGRAKPVIVTNGSRIPSCRMMSRAHFLGGGRGEREDRRPAEPLDDGAEREVVGAEVVSPLAHAVRLVHDEEADRASSSRSKKSRSLKRSGVR